MKVAVTGSSGFIGSTLVDRLLIAGNQVVAIDPVVSPNADPRVDYVSMPVQDAGHELFKDVGLIYHLGAHRSVQRSVDDPGPTLRNNTDSTLAVLDAARRYGVPVVVASSSSVYGHVEGAWSLEGDTLKPMSPYAASKVTTEALCRAWSASYGVRCVCLRYFNVYGPGQPPGGGYAAVIPKFFDAAVSGRPATIYGGKQARDFTFIRDVVHATVLTGARISDLANCTLFSVLNVGAGEPVTIDYLLTMIEDVTGKKIERSYHPARDGEPMRTHANLVNLYAEIGYTPQTKIEVGLRQYWDWFRQFGGEPHGGGDKSDNG